MSYILDALRRAESERERGRLPGLHGQPAPAAATRPARDDPGPGAARLSLWLALLALALGGLALAWYLWPAGTEKALDPLPGATSSPAPRSVILTAAPLASLPVPATLPAPVAAAVPAAVQQAPAPSPKAATAQPPPGKEALPEALRRELPPLLTGGAMYSDTPANRMLIINAQVWHEGDKIAPHLVLEQISLRSAVLVFKGQRFTLSY